MTSTEASQDVTYHDGCSAEAEIEALANLLLDFVRDEPCLRPLGIDVAKLADVMLPWTRALLADAQLCVVARRGDRVVGASFNFRIEPGHVDDGDGWLGSFYPLKELRAHERFAIDLAARAAVCERYGGVPAFLIGVLVCAHDQRGRGVAGGLVRRSLALAAGRGYRLASATATSAYSKRAFEREGFEVVTEASYDDHPNAALFGEEHKRLHRGIVVYAKRLPDAAASVTDAGAAAPPRDDGGATNSTRNDSR